MARAAATRSITSRPSRPRGPINAPARSGASTCEPLPAISSMPLAGILLLGQHHADRRRVGRPLEALKDARNGRSDVEVPDLEMAAGIEDQHDGCRQGGAQVAEHHHQLPIAAVDEHANERPEEDDRGDPEEANHGQRVARPVTS